MSDKILQENQIDESIYLIPKLNKFKLLTILLFISGLGLVINFSIEEIIKDNIKNLLQAVPHCQVGYTSLDLNYLPPQIVISNPTLPGSCFTSTDKNVYLSDLFLKFRGLSIIPFGPKFLITTKVKNSEFYIYPAVGPFSQVVSIEDTIIDFDTLPQLFEGQALFSGKLNIQALLSLSKGKLEDANIKLKSNNLKIIPQNMNLPLPMINIQDFGFKGVLNSQKVLNIETLNIGNDTSPLRGIITGEVKIDQSNQAYLDLKAEIKFSADILKNYSMIDNFLSGRGIPLKNGFYQMKIKGYPSKKNALGLPDLDILAP